VLLCLSSVNVQQRRKNVEHKFDYSFNVTISVNVSLIPTKLIKFTCNRDKIIETNDPFFFRRSVCLEMYVEISDALSIHCDESIKIDMQNVRHLE
jgi:hypothetical protein